MDVGEDPRDGIDVGSSRALLVLVLLGVAIGVLHAAPNVWYPFALGREFRGLPLWNSQDELDRLAAVRAVRNGDYELKNLYLAEEAAPDRPPSANSTQIVPYIVSAWLLRAVGDSPQWFVVTAKALFPGLLFLFLAWWAAAMSRSVWLGAVAGAAAVLLPTLWSFEFVAFDPQAWWASHLIFMRPGTNVAAVIWAGALLAWERDLTAARSRWPVTAALLSLVVYSYFFYWSLTLLFLLVFAGLAWAFGEREWARRTGLALVGCVVLSGYAWLQMARSARSALWTKGDFGGVWNHAPTVSLVQLFVLGLLFVAWRARRVHLLERKEVLLVMAFGLANVIVMNQQVVTGVILEAHHYEWFVSPVLLTVLLSVCLYRIGSAPGGWRAMRDDLTRLLRRFPVAVIAVGALVVAGSAVGLLGPTLPRPTGGLFGRAARLGWVVDKRVATAAVMLVPLVLVASASGNARRRAIAALALVLAAATGMQVAGYRATSRWQQPVQEIMPAIEWLNSHTPKRSVVLATPLVSDYLVAHGHNAVYFSDYAMHSPGDTYRDRALRLLAFMGVKDDALEAALDPRSLRYDPTLKFVFFYWRSFSLEPGAFLDRGRFLRSYTPTEIVAAGDRLRAIEAGDPRLVLGPYQCDYVMQWRNETEVSTTSGGIRLQRDPGAIAGLTSIYDDGRARIFAIEPARSRARSRVGG